MLEVCVPFRATTPSRSATWAFLRDRWQKAGFQVYQADSDGRRPFSAAQARNRAIKQARGDVVVVCDADIMISVRAAHAAITTARETGLYTVAYDRICWLPPKATLKVLNGKTPRLSMGDEEARHTWGACYALPTDLWREAQGFDERFQGWGCQDIAFMFACHTLAGTVRVDGRHTAYHLWHQPRYHDQELNPHRAANETLFERYKTAWEKPDVMRSLVLEHPL